MWEKLFTKLKNYFLPIVNTQPRLKKKKKKPTTRQRRGDREQQALAIATASSPRSPLHPHPHPQPDDVVFIPQSPNDDVLDIAITLMLEDMNRFVQELEDREQSKAEMRKLKEDLDQQWGKYGDNYHRPYRTAKSSPSSSSLKALVDLECFRLYFKGLVS